MQACVNKKAVLSPGNRAMPWPQTCSGHDLDLSGSRHLIRHVTFRFPIGHFLLVVHWYRWSIFSHFRDIACFVCREPLFPYPIPGKIWVCSPWSRPMMLRSAKRVDPRLMSCEISKNSNLCDHNTSTSQTDRRTTDHDNTALCVALRSKQKALVTLLDNKMFLKIRCFFSQG